MGKKREGNWVSDVKMVFAIAVSLLIQNVVTFCESGDVEMNTATYYPLEVIGNHIQEKYLLIYLLRESKNSDSFTIHERNIQNLVNWI